MEEKMKIWKSRSCSWGVEDLGMKMRRMWEKEY